MSPKFKNRRIGLLVRRVDDALPASDRRPLRAGDVDRLVRAVEHNQQRLVAVGRGAEDIGEEAAVREIPVGFAHFRALWREPFDVIGAVGLLAHYPAVWLQLREAMAKARELADKVGHIVLAAQP